MAMSEFVVHIRFCAFYYLNNFQFLLFIHCKVDAEVEDLIRCCIVKLMQNSLKFVRNKYSYIAFGT